MKKLDDMTDDQLEKRHFFKRHLKGIMKALDPDINRIEYKITAAADEFVVIHRKNDVAKRVNVTGDSLFAMTRDVIGSLCF